MSNSRLNFRLWLHSRRERGPGVSTQRHKARKLTVRLDATRLVERRRAEFNRFSPAQRSGSLRQTWKSSNRSHSDGDFDSSETGRVRSHHRWSWEDCGTKPSGDPSDPDDPTPSDTDDTPSVAAVPEVPTAWLMVLGTFALLGAGRLRDVLERVRS